MLGNMSKPKRVNQVILVPVSLIRPNPRQPRRTFDPESLLELSQSIRRNGILQPLTVRRAKDGEYELISGERRLRASLMAGLTSIPCIEIEVDDNQSAVLSLIENLQRQDLNFFEEAEGIARLIEQYGFTQEAAAARIGKTQPTVANKLRLLHLTPEERTRIIGARLTERHARALLRLSDGLREDVLAQVISKKLNVAETERLVELRLQVPQAGHENRSLPVIKDVRLFFNTVTNAVNLMKRSGIEAVATQQEFDDYLEYTVRIPKKQGSRTA